MWIHPTLSSAGAVFSPPDTRGLTCKTPGDWRARKNLYGNSHAKTWRIVAETLSDGLSGGFSSHPPDQLGEMRKHTSHMEPEHIIYVSVPVELIHKS